MEDSERQRADLEELLQVKTKQHQSTLNQHTEQMEQQCMLVEALQNQIEHIQGYFGEYEGMIFIIGLFQKKFKQGGLRTYYF